MNALLARGWAHFAAEPAVAAWASAARRAALPRIADPARRQKWLQCEGTWFVGVDLLPNDATGAFDGAGPLPGAAIAAARGLYGDLPLHPAQVSVVYPGYPRPRAGESGSAFGYRLRRDAAHVDGLLPSGPDRRRMLKEPHAYILGLPLSPAGPEASPLVLWEGSHRVMGAAFARGLEGMRPEAWAEVDLTELYQQARREVFACCPRITLPARPGEAYLLHRFTLHGVAPWAEAAEAPPEGRMIAYFRPQFTPGSRDWLDRP